MIVEKRRHISFRHKSYEEVSETQMRKTVKTLVKRHKNRKTNGKALYILGLENLASKKYEFSTSPCVNLT